jgi:hypothetical protein
MTAVATYDGAQLDALLERLVADGTLQPEQATAVRDGVARDGLLAGSGATAPAGRAVATLAAAYVGVGLLAAAVGTLIAQSWGDMSVPVRSVTFGVLTVLLLAVGAALRGRFDAGRGLAWLVAVVSAAAFGGALLSKHGTQDHTEVFIAAGVVALAVSLPLLAVRRAAPQVLAFVAALVLTAIAVAVQAGAQATAMGLVLWAVGVAVAAAAVLGVLPVRGLAVALGGLVALFALQVAAVDSLLTMGALGLLLAAAGYALAVRDDPAVPLTIATLTVASTGPRILGPWLHDSIGVAGVLAVSGVVVLTAAAVHVRLVRARD